MRSSSEENRYLGLLGDIMGAMFSGQRLQNERWEEVKEEEEVEGVEMRVLEAAQGHRRSTQTRLAELTLQLAVLERDSQERDEQRRRAEEPLVGAAAAHAMAAAPWLD